jgi:hypothetical protein
MDSALNNIQLVGKHPVATHADKVDEMQSCAMEEFVKLKGRVDKLLSALGKRDERQT